MGSHLVLICNTRLLVIDLTYSYLYLHDLSPTVSDIHFIISLLCYYMLYMIRQLVLVHWYPFQYSKVCSSMMSIHLKGEGSARDTRVSLINIDMVFGLIKCCWMSPFPMVCRGSLQVVTTLFCAIVTLHVRLGGRRFIKCCDGLAVIFVYHFAQFSPWYCWYFVTSTSATRSFSLVLVKASKMPGIGANKCLDISYSNY